LILLMLYTRSDRSVGVGVVRSDGNIIASHPQIRLLSRPRRSGTSEKGVSNMAAKKKAKKKTAKKKK